jgi:carbon storage regulator
VRRRAGEKILIACDVEIEILEISRTRVKLGVRAPQEVSVLRSEARRVAEQNRAASVWVNAQVGAEGTQLMELLRNLRTRNVQTPVGTADE